MTMKVMTAIMAASFVAAGGAAWAVTVTDSFDVTATVYSDCTVSVSTLGLGNLDTTTAASKSGTATITCTGETTLTTVKFSGGSNPDTTATPGVRRMKSGTDYIPYTLTVEANEADIDEDVAGEFTETNLIYSADITADVAAGTRAAGNYTDTVTMEVIYSYDQPT